ncbi:MAG: hypothetical protein IIX41_07505, partial [Bacteroidales bacterium]|nr:hypothetical protein [Bacteroidales bacterium]
AIFTLNKTGSTTPPVRIIITGVEKDGNGEIPAVSKKVAVTAGKWTVTETPWSWTYTPSVTSITKDDVADINQRNFVFSNTKKNTKLPLNHEKGVSNTMGGSANNAY